jgi:hypothetical protein
MTSTRRTPPGATQAGRAASKTTGQDQTPPETAAIEHDIEHTRQQLGETVQALADKADVPERVKDKVHATTDTARAKADEVTHQAQEGAHALAAKAGDVAGQAKTLTNQTLEQLPPPVRERVEQTATTARQRPVPTAVVVLVVVLLLRRLLRRSR